MAFLGFTIVVVSTVYVSSVMADTIGTGRQREVFTLAIGDGPVQIGYVESNGDVEAWGPESFTVLSTGNIAVLDAANQRLMWLTPPARRCRRYRTPSSG